MWISWLIIIILLVIIEVMTINLVTIWYVASGIVALILSLFVDDFVIQLGVFSVLGTLLLITTRKTLNSLIETKKEATNFDRIIGMPGKVTEPIEKNSSGAVKVDGKVWTAYADKNIKVNSVVRVLQINGTKIKVEEE